MSKFNGWTNHETWQCALWIDEVPYIWACAEEANDAEELKESIEGYLDHCCNSQAGSLLGDIVGAWISEVNFQEILENRDEDAA